MYLSVVIVYLIMCYGIANTIIFANGPFHIFRHMHSFLDKRFSQLNELLSCFICLPWWLGIIFSALNWFLLPNLPVTPMNLIFGDYIPWYFVVFFDGAFTSGGVWIIHTIQESLEKEEE